MKLLACVLFANLVCGAAIACPEFDKVDLANGDSVPVFLEISSSNIALTPEEFYSMPNWAKSKEYGAYKYCSDAMRIITLKHKSTGRIFKAITSYKDECDGGNSVGALYTENLLHRVADIGDSFISCYR